MRWWLCGESNELVFHLCMRGKAIILVGQYPAAGVPDGFGNDVAKRAGERRSFSLWTKEGQGWEIDLHAKANNGDVTTGSLERWRMFSGFSSTSREERERISSVLEVSVGDAAVVEVVDGIEDRADDSDDAMQNSKPSWNLNWKDELGDEQSTRRETDGPEKWWEKITQKVHYVTVAMSCEVRAWEDTWKGERNHNQSSRNGEIIQETGRQSMHNVCILARKFYNSSELEFQVFHILVYQWQARVWDTAKRDGQYKLCSHILHQSHDDCSMAFSPLMCPSWRPSLAVISHLGTSRDKITATDWVMMVISCTLSRCWQSTCSIPLAFQEFMKTQQEFLLWTAVMSFVFDE